METAISFPLTVTTAIAISEEYDTDIRYCSNRKEIKDHGDKGILLGSPIGDGDQVLLIEVNKNPHNRPSRKGD